MFTNEERQNQEMIISPYYRPLVHAYYRTTDEKLKVFFRSQMRKLRLQETNAYTRIYLAWFEENLDSLNETDLGNSDLYKDFINPSCLW